jgi:serine O-acetyltransferase
MLHEPLLGDSGHSGGPRRLRSLFDLIKEDWQTHECDWLRPGFHALAVYRFGVWRMGIRTRWLRMPWSALYRALNRGVRSIYGIELPYSAKLGRRIVIEHQGEIVVHGNTVIGDDCTLRQGVTLGNRYRSRPFDAPALGRCVDLGAGAKILGQVRIGDCARVGANAVVLADIPAGATAVGVPAKVLRDPVDTAQERSREAMPVPGAWHQTRRVILP